MDRQEMMKLIGAKARELVDRAIEYENPLEAVLDAWKDAQDLRRRDAERQGAELAEWRSLAELRVEIADQERALLAVAG